MNYAEEKMDYVKNEIIDICLKMNESEQIQNCTKLKMRVSEDKMSEKGDERNIIQLIIGNG